MNRHLPINILSFEPELVSVIIPTYNRSALLVEAIESVRRQTWTHVQIIVVDDGSTDGTRAKIERMNDVDYIWQSNKGQAAARNAGLRVARGEFICTLDSDDLWQPNFLKESIEALRQLRVDFVFSNWFRQNGDGSQVRSYFESHVPWCKANRAERSNWRIFEPEVIREIIQWICVAPSSAFVFRRELVLPGWRESVKVTDDWAMLQDIVIAKPCRVGVFMPRSWVKRVNDDNVCDVETTPVRRAMEIDSPQRLVRENYARLSRHERARIYRRISMNVLEHLRRENISSENLIRNVSDVCTSTFYSFFNAPGDFLLKLFLRGAWSPAEPSAEALRNEGLLEPPGSLELPDVTPVNEKELA